MIEQKLLEIAQSYLYVREITSNRSPEIDRWIGHFGLDKNKGYAWCAAAVCAWLREACERLSLSMPVSGNPGVLKLIDQFDQIEQFIPAPYVAPTMLTPGRLAFWTRVGGPGLGHVGVIEARENIEYFTTIEGNVSPDSGSEPQGVHRKKHSIWEENFLGIAVLEKHFDLECLTPVVGLSLDELVRKI